jgi:hypothetical protein
MQESRNQFSDLQVATLEIKISKKVFADSQVMNVATARNKLLRERSNPSGNSCRLEERGILLSTQDDRECT